MIYISEDGYFATNILDYEYSYFIGKEAAGQIIRYVQKHSTETATLFTHFRRLWTERLMKDSRQH